MSTTRNRTLFVIVSINENVIEIDKYMISRLFTKFARSYQRTGLGLCLSKNINEAHGVNIRCGNN